MLRYGVWAIYRSDKIKFRESIIQSCFHVGLVFASPILRHQCVLNTGSYELAKFIEQKHSLKNNYILNKTKS